MKHAWEENGKEKEGRLKLVVIFACIEQGYEGVP
jgi:hypothetical protein